MRFTTPYTGIQPYKPPTVPPPTGFNSYTDSNGQLWISRNGSAWKPAGPGTLYGRAYSRTTQNVAVGWYQMYADTVDFDPYGMYNVAPNYWVIPVYGLWYVNARCDFNGTPAGANRYIVEWWASSTGGVPNGEQRRGTDMWSNGAGQIIGGVATGLIFLGPGMTCCPFIYASASGGTTEATYYTQYSEIFYLGPG